MSPATPRLLLVGSSFRESSPLALHLCLRGCASRVANSLRQAEAILAAEEFDLVLSEFNLPGGSAFPLLAQLQQTRTSLYFCVGVYQGCWWLPALSCGRTRWGEPALRPSEFVAELEVLLDELASEPARASAAGANVVEISSPANPPGPQPLPAVAAGAPSRKATA